MSNLALQLIAEAKRTGATFLDLGNCGLTAGKPDDLVLRFRYEFMPKGIVSRLTVRLHLADRRPLIYTFFKNADIKSGDVRPADFTSLWRFHARLRELGHFWTSYDNTEHLKRQFSDQIDALLDEDGRLALMERP